MMTEIFGPNPPLTGTIVLDGCWVCGLGSSLEEHHIVPRTYGGSNGPTVTLCGICHTAIHNLSFKRALFDGTIAKNFDAIVFKLVGKFCDTWDSPTHGNKAVAVERAYYLSSIIFKSRFLTKKEVNKPVKFNTVLPGPISGKLKLLAKTYNLNQEEMVLAAIEELYDIKIGMKLGAHNAKVR